MSDERIPLGAFTIAVQYRLISCVGCRKIFAPGRANPDEAYPRVLHLVRVEPESVPGAYQIAEVLADPHAWLSAANAAGWRKVTLYGQTMYVCPDCRKNRARPEWERPLI